MINTKREPEVTVAVRVPLPVYLQVTDMAVRRGDTKLSRTLRELLAAGLAAKGQTEAKENERVPA
jgi:hypothetical protein